MYKIKDLKPSIQKWFEYWEENTNNFLGFCTSVDPAKLYMPNKEGLWFIFNYEGDMFSDSCVKARIHEEDLELEFFKDKIEEILMQKIGERLFSSKFYDMDYDYFEKIVDSLYRDGGLNDTMFMMDEKLMYFYNKWMICEKYTKNLQEEMKRRTAKELGY